MKKKIFTIKYLYLFLFICFIGCSSDDENVISATDVNYFVKKVDSVVYNVDEIKQKISDFNTAELGVQFPNNLVAVDMITYNTKLPDNSPITASGIVIYPKDIQIKGVIVGMHYTITADIQSPSTSMFDVLALISTLGYAVIVPDYIGFGITKDIIHPYLHVENTARVSIDMFRASREYLKSINKNIDKDSVYVVGYSQGGAAAAAFQKVVERDCKDIKIKKVISGGGPLDINATFEHFLENDDLEYPCSIPFICLGLDYAEKLNINYSNVFSGALLENYKKWFISKLYKPDEINDFIGSFHLVDFMHPDIFKDVNQWNEDLKKIYNAAKNNSMIEGWTPKAELILVHGTNDHYVPMVNSQNAYNSFKAKGANVSLILVDGKSHVETASTFSTIVLSRILQN